MAIVKGLPSIALLLVFGLSLAARAEQPKLAVLEFDVQAGVTIDRTYFSDKVRQVARKEVPQLFVMTKESSEMLLKANGTSLDECYEKGTCEVEIAKLMQADYVVSGRLTKLSSGLVMTLRLHATGSGELIDAEEARGADDGELAQHAEAAVKALLDPLTKRLARQQSSGPQAERAIGGGLKDVAGGADEAIVPFDSVPAGAVVMVDGDLLCQATPCSRTLMVGKHLISMQKEGYEAASGQFDARKGAKVSLTLPRVQAKLMVETTPSPLPLVVDGKPAGQSPLTVMLAPGDHEVLVNDPCWERAGQSLLLKKGEDRPVHIAPKERQAGLKVNAEDNAGNAVEAHILVDGKDQGTTPSTVKVSACAKTLRVQSDKGSYEQPLSLSEGTVVSVRAKLAPVARPVPPPTPAPVYTPPPTYSSDDSPSEAGKKFLDSTFVDLCCRTLFDLSATAAIEAIAPSTDGEVRPQAMTVYRLRSTIVSLGLVRMTACSPLTDTGLSCDDGPQGFEFGLWPLTIASWTGKEDASKGGWGVEPYALFRSVDGGTTWTGGVRAFFDIRFMYFTAGIEGSFGGPETQNGWRGTFGVGTSAVWNNSNR